MKARRIHIHTPDDPAPQLARERAMTDGWRLYQDMMPRPQRDGTERTDALIAGWDAADRKAAISFKGDEHGSCVSQA
jgi:hypothetical protein